MNADRIAINTAPSALAKGGAALNGSQGVCELVTNDTRMIQDHYGIGDTGQVNEERSLIGGASKVNHGGYSPSEMAKPSDGSESSKVTHAFGEKLKFRIWNLRTPIACWSP